MSIVLDGTAGIDNDATDLSYTGTLTGGTGVVNLGSGQFYKGASGNVGIGTSSPTAQLHVNRVGDGTYAANLSESRTKAGFTVNPESTGSSVQLNISKSVGSNGIIYQPTNSAGTTAYDNIFNPFGGNLMVGKASSSLSIDGWRFESNGRGHATFTMSDTNECFIWNNTSTAGTAKVEFRTASVAKGSISWNNSSTSYNTSSDYRLKENVAPMTGALAKVAALKPCTYTWKVDGSNGQGFIAHELAEVEPGCVTGEKDAVDAEGNPVYQGIDTSFLVATLTAAIQELKAINDAQAQTIESLTARVVALENQIV